MPRAGTRGKIIKKEAESNNEDQGGCLVHGDFNPSNILVKRGRIVAVLDWEFSHSGNPLMDISNLLRNTPADFHDEVKRGIEASGVSLPGDWLLRCDYFHLGSYLEFLTTRRSDSFKSSCVLWIKNYVRRVC